MKIALLHLDLCGGPQEDNLIILQKAIRLAAEQGANWIITPETAVQGYFFAKDKKSVEIEVQPSEATQILCEMAALYGITLFLGCAERDAVTEKTYNSCLVIGPNGEVLGRHRKMQTHGVGAEAWVTKGKVLEPISCGAVLVGVLICADSWFIEYAETLKDKRAQVILIPAAWPPGECGPGDCWERCSLASGLPVWVCNQTGTHEVLDMSQAESAVVVGGKKQFTYSGQQQAVLLFDWDFEKQCTLSRQFSIIAV